MTEPSYASQSRGAGASTGRAPSLAWGLLAASRISEWLIKAASRTDAATISAVGARSSARAASFAASHAIGRFYGSYTELLEDDEIDAIYISTPNSLHYEWADAALRRGKHVLCEKPLTRHPEEAQALADLAEREGRLLREAFMYKHHPQTAAALELVRSGAIGELAEIHGTLRFRIEDPAHDPRMSSALDGGALLDVGCYCVSAARLFAGSEPTKAFGEARRESSDGVDTRFAGSLIFDRVTADFTCAMDLPRRDGLALIGDTGTIEIADPWHCRLPSFMLIQEQERRPVFVDPSGEHALQEDLYDTYRLELEAFAGEAADLEAGATEGADDRVGQAQTIDALLQSAERGEVVTL